MSEVMKFIVVVVVIFLSPFVVAWLSNLMGKEYDQLQWERDERKWRHWNKIDCARMPRRDKRGYIIPRPIPDKIKREWEEFRKRWEGK